MKRGAVVVTHRSGGVLLECLSSLAAHEPEVVVVVVDSGSPEGPPAVPDGIEVVALTDNVGYGAACNAGVRALGDADVICVLNPDVRLEGPSITELANQLDQRPAVGVASGPVVDPSGVRMASAWGRTSAVRGLWFASGLRLERTRAILRRSGLRGSFTSGASSVSDDLAVDGHVLGGAMVVRRACWNEIGGFDEDYFLYWEDADLCHRARREGWEVRILPCTPFVHAAGTSSHGIADEQRWRWYVEGADTFARKHLTERDRRRLLAALRWGRRLRR